MDEYPSIVIADYIINYLDFEPRSLDFDAIIKKEARYHLLKKRRCNTNLNLVQNKQISNNYELLSNLDKESKYNKLVS